MYKFTTIVYAGDPHFQSPIHRAEKSLNHKVLKISLLFVHRNDVSLCIIIDVKILFTSSFILKT